MLKTIQYYRNKERDISLSLFLLRHRLQKEEFRKVLSPNRDGRSRLVQIIAYCLMPTHIHFILKQLEDGGISTFMRLVLNSYARYFNIKHKRKGPLWQNRFKNILVESDEQLYHLSRYVHKNPIKANLVHRPEQWRFSSYLEYIHSDKIAEKVCDYQDVLDIQRDEYIEFVNNDATDDQEGHL